MKKKIKEPKGPTIEDTYETEIEYTCPVRGIVKQTVKVKRLAKVEQASTANEILPNKSISEKLDVQFSGLMLDDDLLEEDGEKLE